MRVIKSYEQFSSGGVCEEYREFREGDNNKKFFVDYNKDIEDITSVKKKLEAMGVTHFRLYSGVEEPMPKESHIERHIMRGNHIVGTLVDKTGSN